MKNSDAFPFVFFGILLVLTAALIVWSIHYGKKRTREFTEIAQQIGFKFLGKTWRGPVLSPQHKMSLLQRTRGRFSNAMIGSAGGLHVSLFDYTYQMGKSTVTQTLASFSQDLHLPSFELRAENIFDRIGDAFVHKDINFDSHPEFSRRYFLRSPDASATRKLFTPSLLTYLEQIPADKKWHVEASATTLIVYRGGGPLKASDILPFLDEASAMARTILSAGGLSKPVA
jgi:hypothetical protein